MNITVSEADIFLNLLAERIKKDYMIWIKHPERDGLARRSQQANIKLWHDLHNRLSEEIKRVEYFTPHYISTNISSYRIP